MMNGAPSAKSPAPPSRISRKGPPMSYYVRVGDVPRKRHIWHRGADGHRLAEELMGEEGFSGASSLLYHLPLPERHHRASSRSTVGRSPLAPTSRSCPGTSGAPQLAGRRGPGDRPPGPARQRRRHHLLGGCRRPAASCTATPPGTSWCTCRRGRPRWSRSSAPRRGGRRLRASIPASTTHRWVVPAGRARLQALVLEADRTCRAPGRYLTATGQLREGAPFSERDLRPPPGPLVVDEDGPVPVLVRAPAGMDPPLPRPPPLRRGGLGRLRLPVRPLDPRFRTARRAHPPAAAGAPDLRRTRIRGVQLRAPPVRLRPDVRQGPLPPRQRRLRRGAVLLGGRLHEPEGRRHRGGVAHRCTPPGSCTARSRAASRPSIDATRTEETAVMVDTFAPARDQRRRPLGGRRRLPLDLGPAGELRLIGRPSTAAPATSAIVAGQDLVDDLHGRVGVQERQAGHRLALPFGRRDEADLVGQQLRRPGVVVGRRPSPAGGTAPRTAPARRSSSRCGVSRSSSAVRRARSRAASMASR